MSYLSVIPSYLAPTTSPFRAFWGDSDPFGALLDYSRAISPRFEVEDTDAAYLLSMPLPGFKREEVDIQVDRHGVLSVSAKRGKGEKRYEISRSITLGDEVDTSAVTAKLEDGILTVTATKRELPQPRRITLTG